MTDAIEACYRIIGLRIRRYRRLRQMTQGEIADRLGMTRASINNIELGRQRIMLHGMIPLARILGIEPGELLKDIDSKAALEKLRSWKRKARVIKKIVFEYPEEVCP